MIRLFVVLYDGVSTDSQRNVILLQSMPSMKRGVQFQVAKHLFGIFPQRPRILSTLKIFIANYFRKIQLQSFVDRVCRHPVLANSEVSTNAVDILCIIEFGVGGFLKFLTTNYI